MKIFNRVKEKAVGWLHRKGFPLSDNDKKLLALKEIHQNKRAFIVGNGPSLKVSDLERLKGEVTFASNKIFLAFDQTEWRPSYYSVSDHLVAKNNGDVISNLKLAKLLSDDIMYLLPSCSDALWFHEMHCNGSWLTDGTAPEHYGNEGFSTNLLEGSASGWTIIYHQLQIAYYMGIQEAYLIGVDFSFDVPKSTVKTAHKGYENAICSVGERNHFHPNYRERGETWALPNMEMQRRAFSIARNVYESSGRKLLNASRKTKLDVVQMVEFDRLFEKQHQQ